jgi:leucyl-tRNA---protein transferase
MKGKKLDLFLSKGYYRMQQDIFTCQYLIVNDRICPVYWLRIDLADVRYGPRQSRLFRINEKFSVAVKPFVHSDETERLYAVYRTSLDFDTHNSVEACLLNGATHSLFDTYVIEIRDENTLIAAGIFDNGERSIAGIVNFYHPDYRRHSLGKYLMLLKIEYAQRQRMDYYYPGYIVSNYPKFDYKLFACESATELYDAGHDQWLPFAWETVSALTAGWLTTD